MGGRGADRRSPGEDSVRPAAGTVSARRGQTAKRRRGSRKVLNSSALPADIVPLIDAAVMEPERVIVGTGGRTSEILVAPAALLHHPAARVAPDLARPRD